MAANIFTKDAVADFYNQNFINVDMDMEKDVDGVMLSKVYKPTAFPTLLFIDPHTELVVHRVTGGGDVEYILSIARVALSSDNTLAGSCRRYRQGERSPEFVKKLMNDLKLAHAKKMHREVAEAYFDRLNQQKLEEKENWELFKAHIDNPYSAIFKKIMQISERLLAVYMKKEYTMSVLEIKNLHVSVEDKEILKGLNLTLKTGEIAAIMGPNGTGKSTLSAAIMGNPNYEITEGDILFDGESILDLEVDERARLGLFLAMQYPAEIPGITNAEFIRAAMNAGKEDDEKISVLDFITKLDEKMELLGMREEMAERYLNEGFSGGEKKRNEILQLLMLEPKFALLDEIDSGLDIDALKVVSKGVNAMRGEGFGAMIITHYQRLLNYITPDVVHVMMEGQVVLSGGPELAARLEQEGYAKIAEELGYEYHEEA